MQIAISIGSSFSENERSQKGKSLLASVDNYVAVDLETTGLDPYYDKIIEIAALRIADGQAADSFQTLINPGCRISSFIGEFTGITNEMLENAPGIATALPEFLKFVGDSIIVGHNVNFDINFLYDSALRWEYGPVMNDFIDTMRLSKRLFSQERHHRLCDLLVRFGLGDTVAHRAMVDAIHACQCYEYMKSYMVQNKIEPFSLYPTKDQISAKDVHAETTEFDETSPFFGKIFVFTGALQKMVRKDAMQLVANLGGACGDGVTNDTSYLVLGNNDYNVQIKDKDGKSSKQKKAEQMHLAGHDIEIISEGVFYDMLAEWSRAEESNSVTTGQFKSITG